MHSWITFVLLWGTNIALSTENIGLEKADNHCHEASIHELRTVVNEMKQELKEERTARIQQQKQMENEFQEKDAQWQKKFKEQIDHMESENREKEAQWQAELKHVTDSCMASNLALEERIKRNRPGLQNEYSAWGCAFETITLTCPSGTILVTNAQYGMYNTTCTDGCCIPDTTNDCSENVNQNTPSDWANLKALCDGKTSCAYEYNGRVIDACQAGYVADYMQVFFDCESELEIERDPVGFTAHATAYRQYEYKETILFDYAQSNFGGHYDSTTCTFTCPHHGIYQFSVNFNAYQDYYMYIEIVRDGTVLGEAQAENHQDIYIYSHSSAFVIVECDVNEKVWARSSAGTGYLNGATKYSQFTGFLLHRYT